MGGLPSGGLGRVVGEWVLRLLSSPGLWDPVWGPAGLVARFGVTRPILGAGEGGCKAGSFRPARWQFGVLGFL